MGSWYLETFKMTLYIFFPVMTFYVFNQPEIYNKYIKPEHSPKPTETLAFMQKHKEMLLKKELEKAKGEITLL